MVEEEAGEDTNLAFDDNDEAGKLSEAGDATCFVAQVHPCDEGKVEGAMRVAFGGDERSLDGEVAWFAFSHPGDELIGGEGFGIVVGRHSLKVGRNAKA